MGNTLLVDRRIGVFTYGIFSIKIWFKSLKDIQILSYLFHVTRVRTKLPLQAWTVIELWGFGFKMPDSLSHQYTVNLHCFVQFSKRFRCFEPLVVGSLFLLEKHSWTCVNGLSFLAFSQIRELLKNRASIALVSELEERVQFWFNIYSLHVA